MSEEALKFHIPKLPELDKEDVKAVRSFLPGKLLGRTAALLSFVALALGFAIAAKLGLREFFEVVALPQWAYGVLIGLPFLAVVAQVVLEWRAQRNRTALQALAIKAGVEQTGYFRIGPYLDNPQDRAKFSRPDRAEERVLEWLKAATQIPLYLTGDSGSGKSSLLNAFALPKLREAGWTVVEARAWQDPQDMLRDALLKLPGARRPKGGDTRSLREIVEESVKRGPERLLIVLDQFEEFLILANSEKEQEFAAFIKELQSSRVRGLTVLLVLRTDYQTLLEDIGLPRLRSGENLFQVARFQFSAASTFMNRSGLDLQANALDHLLTSAAELDDTPGLVRPITLNVIGYVLASGKAVAPSLDAGTLVRQYIERTLEQPAIRDRAPQMLEQMITEQGTKQPCSEQDLIAKVKLRPAEVRAILNALNDNGLARPLDSARGVWELSHDFIARAVARFLGRQRGQKLRHAAAYVAPALLAIGVFCAVGVWTWNLGPERIRSELANYGITTKSYRDGLYVRGTSSLKADQISKVLQLLAELGRPVRILELPNTGISSLEPLKGLTTLQGLNLSHTLVSRLEPLKGLTALQGLYLSTTYVSDLEPLKDVSALKVLNLSNTPFVSSVEPLKGLTSLQSLDISNTRVSSLEPLKGLTALESLYLGGTQVSSLEPLYELPNLKVVDGISEDLRARFVSYRKEKRLPY